MPKQLVATSATFSGVLPVTAEDQITLIGLTVMVNLHCVDVDRVLTDTDIPARFDAWAVLSDDERAALQGINNTLAAYIAATYFA